MRLDVYLVQKGIAASRERAKERIAAGEVFVNEKVALKPAQNVVFGDAVVAKGEGLRWVSRAGLKLEHALDEWNIDVADTVCLDIGASTGGFTNVLLERGARRVFALDVGHGQLHDTLKKDDRVVNLEGTHIKDVTKNDFDEDIQCVVIDVSFISLTHVLPKAVELMQKGGIIVALIKPQFEVGKDKTKKGIVTDTALHKEVIEKITSTAKELRFVDILITESPVLGGDGNKEFLLYAHT